MHMLFITATRLGDAVISTGILAELLRRHPGVRVTIACGPVPAELFSHVPGLERILVMEKHQHDLHWLKLWKECVRQRWDITVDLRGSAITLFLRSGRRLILRGGRRPGPRIEHLAALLGQTPPPLPTLWCSEAERAQAQALIPHGQTVIALGPTANWSGKIWPIERHIELWQSISQAHPQARPAIFYGPGTQEAELAHPLLDALPDALDMGGRFTLTQTAALLAQCALYVGNDSGLMHMAAAAGAPTLGLFGPSRASEYAPAGPQAHWVAAPGPEGEASIADLSVETVARAALALLHEKAP